MNLGRRLNQIVVRKLQDRDEFYCTECGTAWVGTEKDRKLYKMKVPFCPHCYAPIKTTFENKDMTYTKSVELEDGTGYIFYFNIANNKVNELRNIQVMKREGKKVMLKNCTIQYLMNWNWSVKENSNDKWRKTQSQHIDDIFYKEQDLQFKEKIPRKKMLEETLADYDVKSNQKYILMNNFLTYNQAKAIVIFDLKSAKDVYKYAKYLKGYWTFDSRYKHNIYDLEYIASQHIPIGDYDDYLEVCEHTGIVNKHPRDFRKENAKMFEIKQDIEDSKKADECREAIKKRSSALPSIENKDMVVEPFPSVEDVRNTAKAFHNCMFRLYAKKYAIGETDLYRAVKDGDTIACIEIKNNKVMQIRGDYNNYVKEEKTIRKLIERMLNNEKQISTGI